mmetsp:Transcript_11673/g.13724  ORF Transcript_11673/g.13724 Transcript_11673/m.13724 type:complete len:98 (+) Transcript_11673:1151-1444(+)
MIAPLSVEKFEERRKNAAKEKIRDTEKKRSGNDEWKEIMSITTILVIMTQTAMNHWNIKEDVEKREKQIRDRTDMDEEVTTDRLLQIYQRNFHLKVR